MESIVIRCIRNGKDSSTDDIIKISPNNNSFYDIKIFHGEIKKSYTQLLTYANVFSYVHSLMTLLIHDDKPFIAVQLDIPNTPSVYLNINTLDSYNMYNAIHSILHVTLDSWNLRAIRTMP